MAHLPIYALPAEVEIAPEIRFGRYSVYANSLGFDVGVRNVRVRWARGSWSTMFAGWTMIAVGLWSMYIAWGGIVPDSLVLWGKSQSGQRMRVGQRILFGFGGALLVVVGVLIGFAVRRNR